LIVAQEVDRPMARLSRTRTIKQPNASRCRRAPCPSKEDPSSVATQLCRRTCAGCRPYAEWSHVCGGCALPDRPSSDVPDGLPV
jgi:hypothetical protein